MRGVEEKVSIKRDSQVMSLSALYSFSIHDLSLKPPSARWSGPQDTMTSAATGPGVGQPQNVNAFTVLLVQ